MLLPLAAEPADLPRVAAPSVAAAGPVGGAAVGAGTGRDGIPGPSAERRALDGKVAAASSDAVRAAQSESARRGPRTGAVIAVVEDEPGVRALVERLLRRVGHHVLAFPDGTAALDALADDGLEVDRLITDLAMPGPSGIEVARRIRRHRPDLPVVLTSGYATDALRTEGIDETTVDLLAKPFSAEDLLARVTAVLGQRSRPD